MRCQCDSCRRLALSGKYVCHSCAERYPHDGVRWIRTGPGKIRIYVDRALEVEVVRTQLPDKPLFFHIEQLEPWWQRLMRSFRKKAVRANES